jgi:transposase
MEFLEDIHWSNGQAINIKERNLIIHLLGAEMTPRDISLALTRDKRTINKWIERWQQTGELNIKKSSGRPRATTNEEDLNISLHAVHNPFILRQEIETKCELNVSLNTISKRLDDSRLFTRVARMKEHLSAGHKARRLQFAQNNLNFQFWDKTIIVDESTFMTGHAVRTLVRRPICMAFDQKYIVERAQSGRRSIPVFGLMHAGAIGPLVRIEGRFDAEKYIDTLNDTVLPYIEENFPDGHFYYY